MQPRQIRDTSRPVEPSLAYCMRSVLSAAGPGRPVVRADVRPACQPRCQTGRVESGKSARRRAVVLAVAAVALTAIGIVALAAVRLRPAADDTVPGPGHAVHRAQGGAAQRPSPAAA